MKKIVKFMKFYKFSIIGGNCYNELIEWLI